MPSPRDRATRLAGGVRRAVLRRRRLLAALLTAVAVGTGLHATTAPPPARVAVVVAAHDLPSGAVVTEADLTTAAFAPGSVPSGLADAPVGRTLAGPLRAGEPVTDVRLVGPGLAAGHPGLTAVPVRLPDAAMAGLLRAGDRIDLVASDPQGSGARTVAAGAVVVAVPRVADDAGTTTAAGLPGRLVVVGVPPGDMEPLADASVRYFLTFAYTH
ncbi:pilus assembly protein CpaB [Nocardioides sp. KIGAM211]|uniref:Pilus assembly protein CpaB n=1 Tax=Nocardioides luti TaxID=2761101 RepID=A0A7X0RFB3_9ACTN|nr:SAF domain-containing protein [Nocardioides luti]MBB6627231.1 pilus assembly protein CpaB [Nocardioides luti]